jgi:hypothetical protein
VDVFIVIYLLLGSNPMAASTSLILPGGVFVLGRPFLYFYKAGQYTQMTGKKLISQADF